MVSESIQAGADSRIKAIYSPAVLHVIVWGSGQVSSVDNGSPFCYAFNFTIANILAPRSILISSWMHFLTTVTWFKCFLLCPPTGKVLKEGADAFCPCSITEEIEHYSSGILGFWEICSDRRHSILLIAYHLICKSNYDLINAAWGNKYKPEILFTVLKSWLSPWKVCPEMY